MSDKVELKDKMLERHLKIDKFNLDSEWEEQPMRYMYYAEQYVDKAKELADMKNLLSVRTSEIELEYRTGFRVMEAKQTEGSIKAQIDIEPELIELRNKVSNLKGESDMLSSIVVAFEHRKKALENEGALLINGFYSTPEVERVTDKTQRQAAVRAKRVKGENNE